MRKALIWQFISLIIGAIIALLAIDLNTSLSLVLGGLAIFIPNAIFALNLMVVGHFAKAFAPMVLLIGAFAKLFLSLMFIFLVAIGFKTLIWPAMLVGLTLTLYAPILAYFRV